MGNYIGQALAICFPIKAKELDKERVGPLGSVWMIMSPIWLYRYRGDGTDSRAAQHWAHLGGIPQLHFRHIRGEVEPIGPIASGCDPITNIARCSTLIPRDSLCGMPLSVRGLGLNGSTPKVFLVSFGARIGGEFAHVAGVESASWRIVQEAGDLHGTCLKWK